MSVQDNGIFTEHTANGVTSTFAYNFEVAASAHLKVKLNGALQVSGYSVTGVGNDAGGTVVFSPTLPANGVKVLLYREMPLDRQTDYDVAGDFLESTLEGDQDYQSLQIQQVGDLAERGLHFPVGDSQPAELPAAASRANLFLAFDANGEPVMSNGTGADAGLREDIATGAAGAVTFVDTVADMKALTGLVDWALVQPLGYYVAGDFNMRPYRFVVDATPPAANGGTIIHSNDGAGYFTIDSGWVELAQFGMKFNNTAADSAINTAALQAALNSGFPLIVSKGTAIIDDEVSYSSQDGFAMVGYGSLSVIRQKTAGKGIFKNNSGTRIFSMCLRDFDVAVDGSITGGTAFRQNGVSDSHYQNVNVVADSSAQGFLVGWQLYSEVATGGSYRSVFVDCDVRTAVSASAIGIHFYGDNSAVGCSNSNKFYGCAIRADSGRGIYMQALAGAFASSDQNIIDGCSFEGSTATAIEIQGQSGGQYQQNLIQGCRFEGVTTGISYDSNAYGNVNAFNSFTSGVTNTVVDNSGRNWSLEPYTSGTNLMRMKLSRGHFEGNVPNNTAHGVFYANLTSSGNYAFDARASGDTFPRWFAKGSGRMGWGSGSATEDVVLNRTGSKTTTIESGKLVSASRTFADGDATPDISDGHIFSTANTGATTITTFDGSANNHEFVVKVDANTTIQHGSTIKLAGGANFVGTANDTISFVNISGVFYEKCRSVNG